MKPEIMLWLDDHRGIYIPRDFALSFANRAKSVMGVSEDTWTILEAGPGEECYWEAWEEVLNGAVVTDESGNKYRVVQDGDCWLIPDGMEYSETTGFYVWPETEEI